MQIGQFDSIYRLVLVAAERCQRLMDGETPRVSTPHAKFTVIALEEVRQEKVGVRFTTLEGEEVTIGPFPCESSSE